MIDLNDETPITFSQGARRLPHLNGDRPVSPSTLFRWATVGLMSADGSRVRLESRKFGKTHVTSVQALERFFAALNGDNNNVPSPRSPAARRKASSAAARKLNQLGVGV
jgi:hypothetical protein